MITVPFKPGEVAPVRRGAASILANAKLGPVTEAEVHFAAWDGLGQDYAAYPTVRRSEFDIDKVMKRSQYERTWELSKRLKRGRRVPDGLHPRRRRLPVAARVPLRRAPDAGARRPVAPLDYFLNQTHEGYCQHYAGAMALLLRMGGISARVATGFSPGGYSSRKKRLDRARHRRARVGRGLVRQVRLGHDRSDPGRDAGPQPGRRARARRRAPRRPRPPPTPAPTTPRPTPSARTSAVRPELQVGRGDERERRLGRRRRFPFWGWALCVLGVVALVLAVLLFRRRPRGNTPMDRAIAEVEDALRRVGRPVTTGTTMTQLERRLGSHSPEVSAYLRALAAGRYAPSPEPPPKTGRRALRRALAQGLGFGARTRALWALPPRIERAPRTRTLEVETRVRA